MSSSGLVDNPHADAETELEQVNDALGQVQFYDMLARCICIACRQLLWERVQRSATS